MERPYKIKSNFLTYRNQHAYFAKHFNFNEIIMKYLYYTQFTIRNLKLM